MISKTQKEKKRKEQNRTEQKRKKKTTTTTTAACLVGLQVGQVVLDNGQTCSNEWLSLNVPFAIHTTPCSLKHLWKGVFEDASISLNGAKQTTTRISPTIKNFQAELTPNIPAWTLSFPFWRLTLQPLQRKHPRCQVFPAACMLGKKLHTRTVTLPRQSAHNLAFFLPLLTNLSRQRWQNYPSDAYGTFPH